MNNVADLRSEELEELVALAGMGVHTEFVPFGCTAYFDEAVKDKFYLFDFDVLNQAPQMEAYGDGIAKIIFSFTALAAAIPPENEYVTFKKATKTANINLQLDYGFFLVADDKLAVTMLKTLYLKGIRILSFFHVQHFDFE